MTLETASKAAGKRDSPAAGKRDVIVAALSGVTHMAYVGSGARMLEGNDRPRARGPARTRPATAGKESDWREAAPVIACNVVISEHKPATGEDRSPSEAQRAWRPASLSKRERERIQHRIQLTLLRAA